MQDCIFCKIIKGEIPSYKVYEDDTVFAFLDIHPINKGHILVIPKIHESEFQNLDKETYTALMLKVKDLSILVKNKLKPKRVGLMVVGFDVPHTHIHVVPMNDTTDITSKRVLDGNILKLEQKDFEEVLDMLK